MSGVEASVEELKRGQTFCREKNSWLDLERKTRGDAISTEHKQLIFSFWSYEVSRPTGDKKDVIRKKTAKEQHMEHARHRSIALLKSRITC